MPAKGVKRWCGRKSNERRKRNRCSRCRLYHHMNSPGGKGERGSRETSPVRNGGRAVISMAAVAGGRPLGGLEDAPSGCRGPAKSGGGPSIVVGGVPGSLSGGQWTPLGSEVGCSLAGSLRRATHLPWFLGLVRGYKHRVVAVAEAGQHCRCRLWPPGRRERRNLERDTLPYLGRQVPYPLHQQSAGHC